jgi:hypothetical protein
VRIASLLVAACCLAAPFEGASATTIGGWTGFRCPGTHNLVSLGDTEYEVRAECRPPDDVIQTVESRTVRRGVRRFDAKGVAREESVEATVEVQVSLWTYDFGRNQFIRLLRFENGRLVAIADGNKGVAEPE